ncbi:hypothetical protein SteCoe_30781 [Stentor coeruleus]|uniref:Uncharacterized protein n=1 Tax=Stentor coeruleus TaxID=5963 RepID=A0A1R2B2T2_9CILI|nr:hypothetical protein SteCoe_30781 [Stentor coeruleus]
MGCRECKESKIYIQAGEVTSAITDYANMFYQNSIGESITQDIFIREETIFNIEDDGEETVVYSKKNNITPLHKEEIMNLANRISEKARRDGIYNHKIKRNKSRVSIDAGKLLISIQRQLHRESNES